MNSSINKIHCRASGRDIDDLAKQLDTVTVPYQRGPMCFGAGTTEYLNILVPVAAAGIGAVAAIIGAYLKRDKKLRLVFEDGKVKELDSSNYKPDELVEAINKIKEIDISR
ncbi:MULTISPECIES: hypothetical protein [Serratia]|uniref:Uncharacterized protein n=1 Tax=Serratia grimesii TaxID=82995 RepID=A0ABR4U828_9GAMM|nr:MULTISPECIES: hypothetical protein [Serratia]KFB88193.1 hypothetical protein CR62_06445 [Serratia grimesii]MBH3293162.1 hypothetical protein [Serratia marcescens]MBH3120106.1 hypothetical protein [Serratia ureilytica]MBU5415282.1 hypothetical protein [Serratia ureilytica]MDQ7098928.1 hypothetical protein [Serratia sp. MF2]